MRAIRLRPRHFFNTWHHPKPKRSGKKPGTSRIIKPMKKIWYVAVAGLLFSAATAFAQTKGWTPPKTPWGDPDLQGVWNDATSTPLERPDRVGAKSVLNDEEAGDFQQQLANELSRDRRDGIGTEADVARAYNEHWMDSRRLRIADRRTSLIVDPPDGHIPPLVQLPPERAKAKADRAAATARVNAGLPNSYLDFTLPVRCIIRTDQPPYLPIVYN